MPTHCVAFGCHNICVKGNDKKIHFFTFPSDESTRSKWLVAIKREKYSWKTSHRLCSDHFTEDDYERNPSFMAEYGYAEARPRLRTGAVPSVFVFTATTSTRNSHTPVRGAYHKRRKLEVCTLVINHFFLKCYSTLVITNKYITLYSRFI